MSLHGVKCCIRLDGIVVLFTPRLFLLVKCCACENIVCRVLCLLPRLYCLGPCCQWKSVGGSSQVLKIRRDIPKRRQRIDLRSGCEWTAASRRPGRTRPTTSRPWSLPITMHKSLGPWANWFCMPTMAKVGSPQISHQASRVALISAFHAVPMHQTRLLSKMVRFEVGALRLLGY